MKKTLLAMLVLILVGCSGEAEQQNLTTIKDDLTGSYAVSNALVEGNGNLVITMLLPKDSDYERAANRGFNNMGDMLDHVIKTYPDVKMDIRQIYVTFDASLLDSTNAQTVEPVFDIYFNTDKLVNFDGSSATTFYDYLRVAQISVRQPIGYDIIEAWCAGDTNQQDFKSICNL